LKKQIFGNEILKNHSRSPYSMINYISWWHANVKLLFFSFFPELFLKGMKLNPVITEILLDANKERERETYNVNLPLNARNFQM
jgi:hypothetical protein